MSSFWLLARADFSEISQHARGSGSGSAGGFVFAAILAIAALWAALYYWGRFRRQYLQNSSNPKSLFLELCRVHRISRTERALLLRAVEQRKPAQPGILFVDPDVLDAMRQSSSADSDAFAALSEKLFGRSADESPAPTVG